MAVRQRLTMERKEEEEKEKVEEDGVGVLMRWLASAIDSIAPMMHPHADGRPGMRKSSSSALLVALAVVGEDVAVRASADAEAVGDDDNDAAMTVRFMFDKAVVVCFTRKVR